jgi:hypothetical protein
MANINALFASGRKAVEKGVSFESIFDGLWSGNWHYDQTLLTPSRLIDLKRTQTRL